ncbi:MAG TPA: lysophospholipid acyltransferase family protein [Candidatus Brocadiia bacterium]|nr:lysophospholipid acyltransferase family protein [Candidatus Brocadiales bacterium]
MREVINRLPIIFIKFVAYIYFKLFHGIKFYGAENVPENGPVLLVANHVSFYDPIVVGIGQKRWVRFMTLEGYFHVPVLSTIIRLCGAFPVNQSKVDKRTFSEAIKTLKKGDVLGIFPEGGRSPDGQVHDAKPGIALIAVRAHALIVPVTITGAFEAWPRTRMFPLPKRICVHYHKPMTLDWDECQRRKGDHEFYKKISDQIMDRIRDGLLTKKR